VRERVTRWFERERVDPGQIMPRAESLESPRVGSRRAAFARRKDPSIGSVARPDCEARLSRVVGEEDDDEAAGVTKRLEEPLRNPLERESDASESARESRLYHSEYLYGHPCARA